MERDVFPKPHALFGIPLYAFDPTKETMMNKTFDISNFSEAQLTALIDEAQTQLLKRRKNRDREAPVGADGSKGQDVTNPDHGVVPVPTPREVKEEGPAHGVPKHPDRKVG